MIAAIAAPAIAEPKVGDRLPSGFQPADQSGTPQPLASLAGPRGLVLVLARSAGWCPYCQVQMRDLAGAVGPLAAKGYRLAALTYDNPTVLAKFASRQSIPYPLLSDPGGVIIRSLGLTDPTYPPGNMAHGVPRPTIMVVDPAGRIEAINISRDYRERPTTAEVVAMAGAPTK
ncbi:peroxiredoxin family protein [Polymorphobacter multimanifer]|uniref:Peroxiredoxin n=1 Tax=Polymorphobacter multimanifer TaxID=1070431 RepID=A0A841LA01_9SPHN|nr:peroxiredoxin family protein [Polymorphobacter multimanifer]MBB6229477.1 peroxiredoxin [Polymorphobacter multimanifer]